MNMMTAQNSKKRPFDSETGSSISQSDEESSLSSLDDGTDTYSIVSSSSDETDELSERRRVHIFRVSNKGRVENYRGRKTFGSLHEDGYMSISLAGQRFFVHRLIALAFLGSPPSSRHSVDHIDHNRANNQAENLRWATQSEQLKHSWTRLDRKRNWVLCKAIIATSQSGEKIKYKSMAEAAAAFSCSVPTIKSICNGVPSRRFPGWHFEFAVPIVPDDARDGKWESIGNSGWYVSDLGWLQRKNGSVTLGYLNSVGYYWIGINGNLQSVHQLVATAFLPPRPSEAHTIDHINRIRTDNRAENLRWATKREQTLNTTRCKTRRLVSRPVEYSLLNNTEWHPVKSIVKMAAKLSCVRGTIIYCCHSGSQHKGYKFRFANQPDLPGEIWKRIRIVDTE